MPPFCFADPEHDFSLVRSTTGRGVYASASPNYRDAIFGRDSIETAEDVLAFKPDIAREVILTLTWLQGVAYNRVTEEEPGRIHHEYRHLHMDGQRINAQSEQILHQLARFWGGSESQVLYYGSVDATPLFVRLVVNYCAAHGQDILDTTVARHDGQSVTVKQAVMAAVGWVEQRMATSDLGLVEFCRTNDHGHAFQVWKDGSTSYLHVNGQRADFSQPIAAIEVQALAYDALLGVAQMWPDHPKAGLWRDLARHLQKAIMQSFWLADQNYFAQGLDRDSSGHVRQIATLTSNPALLLDTGIFDSLPVEQHQRVIEGIVRTVCSEEFMTPVGIRCRAKQHADLVSYVDYHGAWAVWVKETYDVAKGLRRQGFRRLAEQLEWRILNGVRISGKNYEFWLVDPHGRVDYNPQGLHPRTGQHLTIITPHVAEDVQAWTVSAVLAILDRQQHHDVGPEKDDWVVYLEQDILQTLPQVQLIETPDQAEAAFPTGYYFTVDIEEGKRRRLATVSGVSSL